MRIHEIFLNETTDADHHEYNDLAASKFNPQRAPNYAIQAEMSIEIAKSIFPNSKLYTKKTDSGNFFAQWLENESNIAIVGIVTKSGSLIKQDYKEMMEFIDLLINKINEGKEVITSPNQKSMKLIKRMERIANAKGVTLDISTTHMGNAIGGDPNDPELDFYQVFISKA